LPAALALSRVAERTLGKVLGSADKARRLALSLFFRAALGIERIFPFESLDDLGFAVLSGGKRVLSRSHGHQGYRSPRPHGCRARTRDAGQGPLARALHPPR
jgi:hypothetical protein